MGLSPGAPRGAPEARANLSASGGKGNTAKSKIVSIAPPLLSPASGGAARRLAACGRCFSDSPQRQKIADFLVSTRPSLVSARWARRKKIVVYLSVCGLVWALAAQ